MIDTAYQAGSYIPQHAHEAAYFCWIRRGRYREEIGNRKRECRPQTVAFHPQGEEHMQWIDSVDLVSFNVELNDEWLRRTQLCHEARSFDGGPASEIAGRLFEEFHCFDYTTGIVIESLLLELAVLTCRPS